MMKTITNTLLSLSLVMKLNIDLPVNNPNDKELPI